MVLTKYESPPACFASGIETSTAPEPWGTLSPALPANACGFSLGKTEGEFTARALPDASVAVMPEMQLISAALEHIGSTARYLENTEKSQPASDPVLHMAIFVIFPFSSPLSVVKLNQVDASVLAKNDSFASKPMYPAPGAASGAHCSGIEGSA